MASARRYAIAGFDPTIDRAAALPLDGVRADLLAMVFAALLAILLAGSPGLPTGRA